MNRIDQIKKEVADRNGVWDAFDQGRLACAEGVRRKNNPHRAHQSAVGFHVNVSEWERGWDAEDRENERRCDQYNKGWLAGYAGKSCTYDPDFTVGWKEGDRERKNPVTVVMPERPEGYYHAPIGTFD